MKKFIILLLSCTLCVMSCKKNKETPNDTVAATPTPTSCGVVKITIVNDTVDFSTVGNCFDWSKGMDFDTIHTNQFTTADYKIKSVDTNCVFTGKRKLEFNAGNDCKLFLDDNFGGNVKKYTQGQTINYTTVANSVSSSTGLMSGRILEEGVTSGFNLNETFYLGTAFKRNGNYYNGWVKVKTLNNYYSCIIVSYGVCKTANTAITAE